MNTELNKALRAIAASIVDHAADEQTETDMQSKLRAELAVALAVVYNRGLNDHVGLTPTQKRIRQRRPSQFIEQAEATTERVMDLLTNQDDGA